MKTKFLWVRNSFALITMAALILVAPAGAQTIAPQTPDSDTTRRQLAEFDRFLDSHPEVASQLRQDPSLVNNPEFVENHSELQQYLDGGTRALLDGVRHAGVADRSFRQSQVDAAVRLCAKVFGQDYASMVGKAAEVAGATERQALRA